MEIEPRRADEPWADYRRRYNRAMQQRYRQANRDRIQQERRAAYAADPEPERQRKRRRHAENPERQRACDRRYDERNPGKRAARAQQWVQANPEKRYEVARSWRLRNLGRCASYASRRRAAELQAIPLWADLGAILALFEEARRLTRETGLPHHVDHIVPLRGRNVCGLHVHTNMRVILGVENVRKRNRVDEELILSLYAQST